ncbi:MAG: hypothetical protein JWR01_2332 [Subtercola sp.]|nr:hypothetical protein [Subtercola sp.]
MLVVAAAAVVLLAAYGCTAQGLGTGPPTSTGAAPATTAAPSQTAAASEFPLATPPLSTSSEVFLPVDSGPQAAATGTVTLDSTGNPASYTVAQGDAVSAIADRFGIYVYGLAEPDGSRAGFGNTLVVTGETLTFTTWLPSCRNVPDPAACD